MILRTNSDLFIKDGLINEVLVQNNNLLDELEPREPYCISKLCTTKQTQRQTSP